MDVIDAPEQTVDYPILFQGYILRTAQRSLTQLGICSTTPPELLEQALHILTFALKLPDAWLIVQQLLVAMAPRMEQAGYRDDWIPFVEKGIVMSQAVSDTQVEAQLSLHLGHLYQLRGRYELSVSYLHKSANCYAYLKDRQMQAEALSRWAYVARLQRAFEDAERLIKAASQLLSPGDTQMAFCNFVRGTIANDQRKWSLAIDCFRSSLAIYQQVGDRRMAALRLGNLGTPLFMSEQYSQAIVCYKQAIALFEELQDPVQKAVMQMNLGNVYSVLGEPQQSLVLYESALPILRRVRDELHLAMLDTNRGIAYRQCQQWSDAETMFLAAIERWRLLGNHRSQANAYDELGVTYLAKGEQKMAKGAFFCAYNLLIQDEAAPGHAVLLKTVNRHLSEVKI